VPCTVFVTAGFVEGTWFWADAVEYLLGQAPAGRHSVEVLGERIAFKLGTPHEFREAWRAIAAPLVFNNEERAPTIERLQKLFSIELPQQATGEFAAMTWDQLREISAGGIEVGGHSWTHAFLPALNRDALHTELVFAKTRLEEELGRPVRTFAYPNGSKRDYTPELAAAVSKAGYIGAAVAYNPEGDNLDPLRIGRWPGGVNMTYFNNVLHGMTQLKRRVGTALARA
jgi:peptidoglycan/xylan/chitin deacetylase (PgdA/CDA1 family)